MHPLPVPSFFCFLRYAVLLFIIIITIISTLKCRFLR